MKETDKKSDTPSLKWEDVKGQKIAIQCQTIDEIDRVVIIMGWHLKDVWKSPNMSGKSVFYLWGNRSCLPCDERNHYPIESAKERVYTIASAADFIKANTPAQEGEAKSRVDDYKCIVCGDDPNTPCFFCGDMVQPATPPAEVMEIAEKYILHPEAQQECAADITSLLAQREERAAIAFAEWTATHYVYNVLEKEWIGVPTSDLYHSEEFQKYLKQ